MVDVVHAPVKKLTWLCYNPQVRLKDELPQSLNSNDRWKTVDL
jgi:hypothetical protein